MKVEGSEPAESGIHTIMMRPRQDFNLLAEAGAGCGKRGADRLRGSHIAFAIPASLDLTN